MDIISYNHQIDELEARLKQFQNELSTLQQQNRFDTSEQIDNSIKEVLSTIRDQTGQETLEGLKAVAQGLAIEAKRINASNPEQRAKDLLDEISRLKVELEELKNARPKMPDGLEYDSKTHEEAKRSFENVRDKYNESDIGIKTKSSLIEQLDSELNLLKPDFDFYSTLDGEVKSLENKIKILEMVNHELGETSKELRAKVIPHARYIINQILPTLTDGRYSDFEITEDLKFKVHSTEAGDYKEREVFSGGTQDQFLIALRLAFTQSILDSRVMADKYLLLMDECISSSDEIRRQGIFEVLDLMKGTFTQIFVIAHEDISSFVDHNIVLERNSHGYTEIRSKSW